MTETERNAIQGRALVLYDGVCALCHGVVQFLLGHDRQDRFRYAPLQSDLGREMLARFDIHEFPDGIVLVTNALSPTEKIDRRSDAIIAGMQLLYPPWPWIGRVLGLLPHFLRDWGYGIIGRYRYRLFGRYDACPLPPPEQRSRLLGVYE